MFFRLNWTAGRKERRKKERKEKILEFEILFCR
jgi:hypothetical protein